LDAAGQQNAALNTLEVFLTTLTPSADQDEWNTNISKAISRAKVLSTSFAILNSK
jgi:hypothetical protein